jgi:hypothetical protein
MIVEDFNKYFNEVLGLVYESVDSKKHARNICVKNYFTIKNGFYGYEDVKTIVKEITSTKEKTINESTMSNQIKRIDEPVRKIVKDITNIVKSQNYGEYMLPEDIDSNQFEYDFDENYKKLNISRSYNIPSFNIEFNYNVDYTINEPYMLNGSLLSDGNTIAIILIVNPKFYPQFMYDLIADLNDMVIHEIEHIFQENFMRPEDEIHWSDEDIDGQTSMEYYTQKHEIPAQIMGLYRVAKLRKQPIEMVIQDWFKRSKYAHQLNDEEINNIVKILTTEYEKRYGTI